MISKLACVLMVFWIMHADGLPYAYTSGAWSPTVWTVAPLGETCHQACIKLGLTCSQQGMFDATSLIDNSTKMENIVTQLGFTCQSVSSTGCDSAHCPEIDGGHCKYSKSTRPMASISCHLSKHNRNRVCYCEGLTSTTTTTVTITTTTTTTTTTPVTSATDNNCYHN